MDENIKIATLRHDAEADAKDVLEEAGIFSRKQLNHMSGSDLLKRAYAAGRHSEGTLSHESREPPFLDAVERTKSSNATTSGLWDKKEREEDLSWSQKRSWLLTPKRVELQKPVSAESRSASKWDTHMSRRIMQSGAENNHATAVTRSSASDYWHGKTRHPHSDRVAPMP